MSVASSPFTSTARRYWEAGWRGTLHLPFRRKANPPDGFTGAGAPYLSKADLSGLLFEFEEEGARHNIGLRVPDGPRVPPRDGPDTALVVDGKRWGVIGIDVDGYHGGGESMAELVERRGALPATWTSSARWEGGDHVSGIRYYRVPAGWVWKGKPARGVDIIQAGHRYGVAWPSIHPDGMVYRWIDPAEELVEDIIPDPEALPELPEPWIEELVDRGEREDAATLTKEETREWLAACRDVDAAHLPCRIVRATLAKYIAELREGKNRHDTALYGSRALIGFGGEGHVGAREAIAELRDVFVELLTNPSGGGRVASLKEARFEFRQMIHGAIRRAAFKNPTPRTGCSCLAWDDVPGATVERPQDAAPAPGRTGEGDTEAGAATAIVGPDATDVVPAGEPAPAARPEEVEFVDARLAEVIADKVFRGRYVWTGAAGWLTWNGRVWEEVTDVEPREAVREWVIAELVRAVEGRAPASRVKELSKVCTADRIGSLTSLARGLVVRDFARFDADPDILVVRNGVVDLRTGKLLPHDPARLVTRCSSTTYIPGARHDDWTAALGALPDDVRPWYQGRLGQAITGHPVPDDFMIVAQGSGQNGKSTVHGVVAAVLGTYFTLVADEVLLATPGQHSTEVMDLKGARFALVEETPEARRLNVARLKKIVGTPVLKARRIRKDPVEWKATHTLFVSSNYRPIVDETDHGTWRRLALVRFPYTFTTDPGKLAVDGYKPAIEGLRDRLLRDAHRDGPRARAALAWLVEGARRFYDAELTMPAPPGAVIADTLSWRAESDAILSYVAERIEWDPASHVMCSDLLADVNQWLREHGARAWGDKVLTSRFGEHDEIQSHGVIKVRKRSTQDGLSRTPNVSTMWLGEAAESGYRADVPGQFWAWSGIRFKSPGSNGAKTDKTENAQEELKIM